MESQRFISQVKCDTRRLALFSSTKGFAFENHEFSHQLLLEDMVELGKDQELGLHSDRLLLYEVVFGFLIFTLPVLDDFVKLVNFFL